MFRFLHQVFHGRKDVAVEEKAAEVTEQKPTKEQIMAVVGRFKLNAADRLVVKPEDEPTIAFLERLGLVTTEVEYSLNQRTGAVEQRKMARWNSWDCSWCANFYVGDKTVEWGNLGNKAVYRNVALCKKGYDLQVRDFMKGKRCPHFLPRQLVEVVGDDIW